MNELMTWANLGTLAGAVAAVLLIVQYVKPLIPKLDTRLLALIVSVIILEAATVISGGGLQDYALAVLNAILVASSAMGAYQVTFASSDAAKKTENEVK
jgi:hypothetical protein